ncbi:MAG: EAL domain-containing protein [Pararhodobacter sp.]|nr:EAL domain-containing protein [Pararhodobacter sp.]
MPEHSIETLFAELLRRLLNTTAETLRPDIDHVLGALGKFFAASRSYVFTIREERFLDNDYEWVAPGVVAMREELQGLPVSDMSAWKETFATGDAMVVEDVAALPDSRPDKTVLQAQGIRSLVGVPLIKGGGLSGFLGLDFTTTTRGFARRDVQILQSIGDAVAATLARCAAEVELRQAVTRAQSVTRRLELMAGVTRDTILECDFSGRFLGMLSKKSLPFLPLENQAAGQPLEEVLPRSLAAAARQMIDDLVQGNEPDVRLVSLAHDDGTAWLQMSVALLPQDESATRSTVVVVLGDRTAIEQARADLTRLGRIVEVMTNLVVVVDTDERITWTNQAFRRQSGYVMHELLGRRFGDVVRGTDSPDLDTAARVSAAVRSGQAFEGETINYTKSGKPYWIRFNIHPLYSADGCCTGYVSIETVITEQKVLETRLQEERDKLRATLAAIPDTLLDLDHQGNLIEAHNRDGRTTAAHLDAIFPAEVRRYLRTALHTLTFPCSTVIPCEGPEGQVWIEVSLSRRAGRNAGHVALLRDVSQRVTAAEQLQALAIAAEARAREDVLTGLPNRRWLNEELSALLENARRGGTHLALVVIDFDNFKSINDTFMHQGGDTVLIASARRMKKVVGRRGTVVRLGGDEFVVVLHDIGTEDLPRLANELRNAMRKPFQVAERRAFVTVSMGVAVFPKDGSNVDLLVAAADKALAKAKRTGRDRCVFMSPAIHAEMSRHNAVTQALAESLNEQHFRLVFQPIFDIDPFSATGGPVQSGAEALLRWNSPLLGDVGPAEFVPIAETVGLAPRLDGLVVDLALAELANWRALDHAFRLHINLSAQSFADPALAPRLLDRMKRAGIPPDRLTVEITETSLLEAPVVAERTTHSLSEAGIKVAVDDFGTGFSSLSYLHRLRVAELKIDRSLVLGLIPADGSADTRVVVRAIIGLARELGLAVVAEGVQNPETLHWLRDHGCTRVQGYLLGKPQEAAPFRRDLQQHIGRLRA